MTVRKPKNSKAAHKHMDSMLRKCPQLTLDQQGIFRFAQWTLTAPLTPCERWQAHALILNWG